MQDLDSPKIPKTLPHYLTLDESKRLLSVVDGKNKERDYCILCIFLNCGLRISELVGLNLQDDHGDSLRILGKGSKERVVYLNDACREALDCYLAVRKEIAPPRTTAMFLSNRRTRISCDSVQVMVKKNLTRAAWTPVSIPRINCGTQRQHSCCKTALTCARCRRCSGMNI